MSERVLFVDLENVKNVDLSHIPSDARVMIFYGITQKSSQRNWSCRLSHSRRVYAGSRSLARDRMRVTFTLRSILARS